MTWNESSGGGNGLWGITLPNPEVGRGDRPQQSLGGTVCGEQSPHPTASGHLGQLRDLPEPPCQRLENGALPSTSPRLWAGKGA